MFIPGRPGSTVVSQRCPRNISASLKMREAGSGEPRLKEDTNSDVAKSC